MKFKTDENLPVEVAQLFQQAGHDCDTVLDENLGGVDDTALAKKVQDEERILVTLDLDFADIRAYPPKEYSGLIVFRLRRLDKIHLVDICKQVIDLLEREDLVGKLWIVEDGRVRIRE